MPLVHVLLNLLLAVAAVDEYLAVGERRHAAARARRRRRPRHLQPAPPVRLRAETVHVVEVLVVPEVVVEAAEDHELLLEVDHAMAASSAGAVGRVDLLPAAAIEAEEPQVAVVVELRLRGAGELAAEEPELALVGRARDHLVAASRRRRRRALDQAPRVARDVVEEQLVVQESLQRAG